MGEMIFLTFLDVFTKQPLFEVIAPKPVPNEGRTVHADERNFYWLASEGKEAVAKQREANVAISKVRSHEDVPCLRFKSAAEFLDYISYINSRKWDTNKIKRLGYWIETAQHAKIRSELQGICSFYSV